MTVPDLIGCYWTLAGAVTLGSHDESPWSFRDRAEAAARAGYRGIGLKHADLVKSVAALGYGEMRAILAGNGLRHLEVEALSDWWRDGAGRVASDIVRRDLIDAAGALGARHIKLYGPLFPQPGDTIHRMREAFADVVAEVRDAGAIVVLEPIGCSGIPDLATALAVIGDTAGRGAGVMLDLWHVTRGGIALKDIAALPAGWIGGVEIDDGAAEPEVDYLTETMNRRRLCGEGTFDIPGFMAAVRSAGYGGPVGVEIISEAERALSLEEAARRSFETACRALDKG